MILTRYLLTAFGSYLLFLTHLFDSAIFKAGETPSDITLLITSLILAWPVSLLWTRKTASDASHLAEKIVLLQELAKKGTVFVDGKETKITKD